MNKLIEEQKKNIMLFIRDFVYKMRDSGIDFEEPRRVELEQWAKQIPNQSLIQFIDSEIELLKEKLEKNRRMYPQTDARWEQAIKERNGDYIFICKLDVIIICLEDQISHLKKIKQELV